MLQEIARDYHANWMTAVEMLNDDVYIGGEGDCNVFTLRRNAGKYSDSIYCGFHLSALQTPVFQHDGLRMAMLPKFGCRFPGVRTTISCFGNR